MKKSKRIFIRAYFMPYIFEDNLENDDLVYSVMLSIMNMNRLLLRLGYYILLSWKITKDQIEN
ncbi:hypothetical protein HZS_623 [Henneguya salminicola]|nr:hypothetical protein HZS_623 [Henneguya salminicola]